MMVASDFIEERARVIDAFHLHVPALDECIEYLKSSPKATTFDLYTKHATSGRVLFQPRVGVGGFEAMKNILCALERDAGPDILTLTIDSYTRLCKFREASRLLLKDAAQLNGYPLVSHGWAHTRELERAVHAPVQVRHGSPDARALFEMTIASGITAFEGGGICYNLPYAKSVPLTESLAAWSYVDRACGEFARRGVIVERELFGTLSAVLMPPCISIAVSLLEAILASQAGVRCITIAYPQGGNVAQDVAALRSIRRLAARYVPAGPAVFPVLHEYMGPFPKERTKANALILYGALTGKLGGAAKVVTKTYDEAFGIPTVGANVDGIQLSKLADNDLLTFIKLDEAKLQEEMDMICSEVDEILRPVLDGPDLTASIVSSFASGYLDIPFSTSMSAQSRIIPMRDRDGAIRILEPGRLCLFEKSIARNRRLLANQPQTDVVGKVLADIQYFL